MVDENLQQDVRESSRKKPRVFSAKEFRKQLQNDDKTEAVLKFLNLVKSPDAHNVICEYLENGGSCLEFLQLMEGESNVLPVFVFEIVSKILLTISTRLPQHQNAAHEACRYCLNTYIALINKMLSLNSKIAERKIALQFLTSMVAFAPSLAKDVLVNVNLNATNIEVLTKTSKELQDVRFYFIQFLIAFLVSGQYATLAVFLEKGGLLLKITSGLQYDDADCVCLFITALKNHILENPSVLKTSKMKIFNTQVIKSIVNLYNWKGKPFAETPHKKTHQVDQADKSKVSHAVHDFLLVLCTSRKHGVIFLDKTVGLSKKHHNQLVYTVLESLDRPWEHSFAGELVVRIVGACPDLARTVWTELKPYLEPRATEKWLNVVGFAGKLLDELKPECAEFCTGELGAGQLAQVVQFLVAPIPILKILFPEDGSFQNRSVKFCVLGLVVRILQSVHNYVTAAEKWVKGDDYNRFKRLISDHIERNFPNIQSIMKDWQLVDEREESKIVQYTAADYLKAAFQLLDYYKDLSPNTLDSLNAVLNLTDLFGTILQLSNSKDTQELFVKAVNLVLAIDPSIFLPNKKIFTFVTPVLFDFYHTNRDASSRESLHDLFKNTSLFEGAESEIYVWIDSVRNVKAFDDRLNSFIIQTFKLTYANVNDYLDVISECRADSIENEIDADGVKRIIEGFSEENYETTNVNLAIRHVNLSPLILGGLATLQKASGKTVMNYFNCVGVLLLHLQTNPDVLTNLFLKSGLDADVLKYIGSCKDAESVELKMKGNLKVMQDFLAAYFSDNFQSFLESRSVELDVYPDHSLNLLQMTVFHLTNLMKLGKLSETHTKNCLLLLEHLRANNQFGSKHLQTIFSHPVLLRNFSPLKAGISTNFIAHAVKIIQKDFKGEMELFLKAYRNKIVHCVFKAVKKLTKSKHKDDYGDLVQLLEIFELELEQCVKIIENISSLAEKSSGTVYSILQYCLKVFVRITRDLEIYRPLDAQIFKNLSQYLATLNVEQQQTEVFAENLLDYLTTFPHNLEHIFDGLFCSLVQKVDYCKGNSLLAAFLFGKSSDSVSYRNTILENIENICAKKGLLLPLLDNIKKDDVELLNLIYDKFKDVISRALEKPQKAGQHFQKHYKGAVMLLDVCFPKEQIPQFFAKIQKYDVSEVFHANLLLTLFKKHLHENVTEKQALNALLTFIHLALSLLKKLKKEESFNDIEEIVKVLSTVCDSVSAIETTKTFEFNTLLQNDSFLLFSKFCLKFGISSKAPLLNVLSKLLQLTSFTQEHASDVLEMIGSHSEFLEVVLNEESDQKRELLLLMLVLCEKWPGILQKNHVPLLLASYGATLSECDRCILKMLKLCEKNASTTSFYDFKPFLWGPAAAGHYSVRADLNSALWRQPKFADVIGLLHEPTVQDTIKYHPLNFTFADYPANYEKRKRVYDLTFLLPLFTQLLSPENAVQTHRFTRSGAMALTVVALGSENEEVRSAACFVLARFHYQLEARQTGKDNALWLRYVEAVCRGSAALENFKPNSFSAIFFARMSLVLTQPGHAMYVPLSNYLLAKPSPNLATIPELYTFLHSPEVNFREHRLFMLRLLVDGMRTKEDLEVALKSAAFKLTMDFYGSSLADAEARALILGVLSRATQVENGVELLCSGYGLLSWVLWCVRLLDEDGVRLFLPGLVDVVFNVVGRVSLADVDYVASFIVAFVLDEFLWWVRKEDVLLQILKVVSVTFERCPKFLTERRLRNIVEHVGHKKCEYYLEYGCKYVPSVDQEESVAGYVTKITLDYIKSK